MNRFWLRYTGPLLRLARPRRILEIGADLGWNTQHLLEFCGQHDAVLDIVDTKPSDALTVLLARHDPAVFTLHARKSIDAIPALPLPDAVMLDGDHNWRTVYAELSLLWRSAERDGGLMPIVLAHDCAWPYARRDMYYNPADFEEHERHPFAYKGMLPDNPGLAEDGLNGTLANALVEGGPENGVLTAIEDFIAAHDDLRLWTLPFFNGLGIVVPAARLTPALEALIDGFFTGEMMAEAAKAAEADGMRARAETLTERKRLVRRTEALTRARALLAARDERIAELEAQLAAARAG